MPVKINNAFIRKIAREKPCKVREFRDADLRGFIVRQQPSGFITYCAVTFMGSARNGSRRQRRWRVGEHPALSPSEARETAAELIAKARLDRLPLERKVERYKLGMFLDEHYLPWAKDHLKAPEAQERQLWPFANWRSLHLNEIDRLLVEKWRGRRLASGVSPNTVNRNVCVVRSVLSKAVEWGFLRHHPLEGLKPLKIDQGRQPRTLNDDERSRLFAALAARDEDLKQKRRSGNEWRRVRGYNLYPDFSHVGDHLTPIVLTAYHTGMRRGEIFSLTWDDVDFREDLITVRGESSKTSQTRIIPMNGILSDVLRNWRDQSDIGYWFVFPARNGLRLDNIQTSWDALRKQSGLFAVKFKDLRSDFGSRLANNGVELAVTQRLLGHSSPVITMKFYVAIQHETMREAVASIA